MRTRIATLCVLTAILSALVAFSSPVQAGIPGVPLCVPLVGQTCSGNVALNTLATSSHLPCTLGSGPENAVDGAASNIYTDKWCVRSGRPTLTIQLPVYDFGFTLNRIVVRHAGGLESSSYNTRAYKLHVKTNPFCAPTTVASVTNNTSNITSHDISVTNVSQVLLEIVTPTQTLDPATRIFEVEAWGSPTTSLPPPCFFA